MSKKLKYKIISCSSEETQYPSSSLLFGGQNGGWQTKRFCTYPQEVTFQFYGPVKIDKIQIISDSRKVPSQVDILFYMPFHANGREADERFQKYGYLNFNKNQNNQFREQKSIMVDIKCLYLRFLFHKPHTTKENFFSQIGIQQISILGNDSSSSFAPLQKLPRQLGQTVNNQEDQDPFIYQKLSLLNAEKEKAVEEQDFQRANQYKVIIDAVKKAGEQLKKLQTQKRQAIQQQDYQRANNLKKSIQQHRKDIDSIISIENIEEDYNGQQYMEENNEFQNNQNAEGASNNLNDFQDNEFVDPEMNEMIKKSTILNEKTSRIKGGNSRVKINKTLLKKEIKPSEYDERVIPTLDKNKLKTEESQIIDKQEEKKIVYEPEQIDGKFIQYAHVMQEHFQEDTVKRFFSQHWQLKVQALGTVLSEIKKKPNADSSFIKCLIVVVKNSITETNFQVALNSLQILSQALKMNAKGNVVNRGNQINNDLDLIIKETIKKLTDNNNKIKQQAQKIFPEMSNSSLYGPQVCANALTKPKEKLKLSSKQLMSRLIELSKIIQGHSNNHQILGMTADYGLQNAKNPASEVRNQALNLLLICRNCDSTGTIQKRLAEKQNILSMLQTYQNKSGPKKTQKAVIKTKKKK